MCMILSDISVYAIVRALDLREHILWDALIHTLMILEFFASPEEESTDGEIYSEIYHYTHFVDIWHWRDVNIAARLEDECQFSYCDHDKDDSLCAESINFVINEEQVCLSISRGSNDCYEEQSNDIEVMSGWDI